MRKLWFIGMCMLVMNVQAQGPVLFAKELFNNLPMVRDLSLSQSKDELYFTVESYRKDISFIASSHLEKEGWSSPEIVAFSGKFKDLEPSLSPDGLRLFFVSNRAVGGGTKKDMDIWYVHRVDTKAPWSAPIRLGNAINTDRDEFYPVLTNSGNLYFTANYTEDTKGKEDIYCSLWKNGAYQKPFSLGKAINSEKYEYNAYVDPAEENLFFTSYGREEDLGNGDLYWSIKKDGVWQPAVHLGAEVNSKYSDYCPFYDAATGRLYFTSTRSTPWKQRSQSISMKTFLKVLGDQPNGLSRIYYVVLNKN